MFLKKSSIILIFILILSAFLFSQKREERYLVRVRAERERLSELSKMDFDFASRRIRDYVDLIVSERELQKILSLGFKPEILGKESDYAGSFDPLYHTYEETVEFLKSMEINYPNLSKLFLIGKSTRFGHPIYAIKISDNPEIREDETRILIDGMHHAREPLGNEICLSLIEYLLTRYGIEERVTKWVNNYEIWIIPIINPEGYKFIVDNNLSSPWWRKNLRDNNNNGKIDYDYDGVDLNRNYDINWTYGGSPDPSNWTYRGPFPFSEEETKAKRDLALREKFTLSVTYHSYGEIIYYPWSWPGTNEKAPDHSVLSEIASEMAKRIKTESGEGFYANETETASNMSPPWMYAIAGTLEFLVEVGTSFIPDGRKIQPIVNSNLEGIFYLLERASGSGIKINIKDSKTGLPISAQIKILEIDDFRYIKPRSTDPETGSLTRLLQPGAYTVLISAPGYEKKLIKVYVGKSIQNIEISLRPLKEKDEKENRKPKISSFLLFNRF
jgi:hypothetical protein